MKLTLLITAASFVIGWCFGRYIRKLRTEQAAKRLQAALDNLDAQVPDRK